MMIGTLLELLEPGGPEAVTEQLSQFPPGQRKELARTVLASGFPVPEALEEFRTLVAEPILHDPAAPHRPRHPDAAHPPEAATPPLIYALRRDHWGPPSGVPRLPCRCRVPRSWHRTRPGPRS
jgi:hypothetical protein